MELIGSTNTTSYTSFSVEKSKYKHYVLQVCAGNRPLASTIISMQDVSYCTSADTSKRIECLYAGDPNNYKAYAYFSTDGTTAYIASATQYDQAKLYGVL